MRRDRDIEATKRLYAKYQPTHVIHLAALGEFQLPTHNTRLRLIPLNHLTRLPVPFA